jgi:tRNA pseudouridine32 synthase/23S rRNA pseudouridine746 synthase
MRRMTARVRPPVIDGLAASTWQLPPGPWGTLIEALNAHFPAVSREAWLDRFARGRVIGDDGEPLRADSPYRVGLELHYYREVANEPRIPFEERMLHLDEHLLVADKPHFLPVTPSGAHVYETLLGRLIRRTGNPDLVPLHRIDRETAGLVLFSANPATRAAYQALFRERRIEKHYEAIAPALPHLDFPLVRRSRIVPGEPFFRMREAEGEPNSETRIAVIERGEAGWRYALQPITGKKHQLRVHLAALGAPIRNDPLYPEVRFREAGNSEAPLQLVAKSVVFVDPVSGQTVSFASHLGLCLAVDGSGGRP